MVYFIYKEQKGKIKMYNDDIFKNVDNTNFLFHVKGTVTKNIHNYILSHREDNPTDTYYQYMAKYLMQGEIRYGMIDCPNVTSYDFDKSQETITFNVMGELIVSFPRSRDKRNMKEIEALTNPSKRRIKHNAMLEKLNDIPKGEVDITEYTFIKTV